jgi:hypothetical protein
MNPAVQTPVQVIYSPQGTYAPPPQKIQDYLIWSILSTLCCCLPLGIAAIVYSVQSKSAFAAGQYELAAKHANTAFYCNLISLIVGLIGNAIVVVMQIIAVSQQNGVNLNL